MNIFCFLTLIMRTLCHSSPGSLSSTVVLNTLADSIDTTQELDRSADSQDHPTPTDALVVGPRSVFSHSPGDSKAVI